MAKAKKKNTKGKKVIAKSTKKRKTSKSAGKTVEMGRWNGHKFIVSPTLIRSFSDLQIKKRRKCYRSNSDDYSKRLYRV